MHFDQVPGDGQAQAEPAVRAGDRGVRLPETVKNERQKIRLDPDPRVRDLDLRAGSSSKRTVTLICRPSAVNLIALESRFQTTCWRRSASPRDLRPQRLERPGAA